LLAAQKVHQYSGQSRIAIVEYADMPGPCSLLEHGRKTVHGDQRSRSARFSPPIQFARNPIVIGLKYLSNAGLGSIFAETDISRNSCEFAQFDDRRRRARRPVAVNG